MRESNGIDFNFHCSGGGFASLDPAGNDRFATSQNTVLQDPLYIAIFGKTVMIYWLKVEATKGAKDMGISNIEGKEAALGQAAKCGDLSLVNYFLALDADPNIWDEHHIFPLHWAVQSGDARICEVLIKAGADVNARTDVWNRVGGHTPLHYCNIPSANLSVIKLLLDNGADPNLRCRSFPSSHTALQNLILRGRPIVAFEVIDLLGDRARFSKLQAMIYSENLEVVRLMLGNGFDAKSKVPQGGSVLAYARRLNRRRQTAKLNTIIELLESHRR